MTPFCHSERSEESRIFRKLRSFASLRMTKKPFFNSLLAARLAAPVFLGYQGADQLLVQFKEEGQAVAVA